MGTNESVLKRLPKDLLYKFPAVLTHKAGMDLKLVQMLAPLLDKGVRPETISDMLLELYMSKYTTAFIQHELLANKEHGLMQTTPEFSTFDNKELYNGAVPSRKYITNIYIKQHNNKKEQLDRDVKKWDLEHMSLDASFKASGKLCQQDGKRVVEALQTGNNSIGQIRVQALTVSDSHDQLTPALDAMINTLKEQGKSLPNIIFTDKPTQDKKFLMEKFESCREMQQKLDAIAKERNDARRAASSVAVGDTTTTTMTGGDPSGAPSAVPGAGTTTTTTAGDLSRAPLAVPGASTTTMMTGGDPSGAPWAVLGAGTMATVTTARTAMTATMATTAMTTTTATTATTATGGDPSGAPSTVPRASTMVTATGGDLSGAPSAVPRANTTATTTGGEPSGAPSAVPGAGTTKMTTAGDLNGAPSAVPGAGTTTTMTAGDPSRAPWALAGTRTTAATMVTTATTSTTATCGDPSGAPSAVPRASTTATTTMMTTAGDPSRASSTVPGAGGTTMTTRGNTEPTSSNLLQNPYKKKTTTRTTKKTMDPVLGRTSVVHGVRNIEDKILALQEEMAQNGQKAVYSLDCEWKTVPNRRSGVRKEGKISLLQIGYRLQNQQVAALLLQLPHRGNKTLPRRLLSFLKDPNAMFVGVNIKNDLRILGEDYKCGEDFEASINTIELRMYARNRDVVQQANGSAADLVVTVLGERLNKADSIRCSDWSKPTLSDAQIRYAALDVIKPLEVYEELSKLPDLSLRLDPESAVPGILVDIVPPHARTNRNQPSGGYRVGDLATRAAIGTILPDSTAINATGITPRQVKTGNGTRLVKVTKVLAPSLFVPKHGIVGSDGRKQNASLSDFGEVPFVALLPLTALKPHIESNSVRTYHEAPPTEPSYHHITPPARSAAASSGAKQSARTSTAAEGIVDLPVLSDKDNDEEEDEASVFDEDLVNLVEDDDDNEDGDIQQQQTNAELQNQLEMLQAAELAARMGNALQCDELEPPPEDIDDVWSAVLGDAFHAMNRTRVPTRHEYKKAFYVAMMNAFFVWDSDRLNEVKRVLRSNGWSDKDIENQLYFRPAFFRNRVERIILPPRQLYWRVRAVYATFGNKVDSKTGRPLFNKAAWKKAKGVLEEILLGLYSDPPGFNFYMLRLDDDGRPKTDKHGIQLLHCNRGTNDVENTHKHIVTTFRYAAGFQLGSALLSERRHRHNERMARRRIAGYPDVGHYNTWQIDLLQILVEKNRGKTLFPGWVSASDYRDTAESFDTVALHSMDLHEALEVKAAEISEAVKNSFSADLKHMCKSMGVSIPFLPVNGETECKLFTRLILEEMEKFDADEMSLAFIPYVNGVDVFPKLPAHLRSYHKEWERNCRCRDAAQNMKMESEMLEDLNKANTPAELDDSLSPMPDDDSDDNDDQVRKKAKLQMPAAQLPMPLQQPHSVAKRPPGALYVGLEMIGDPPLQPSSLLPIKRKKGQRGQDEKPRRRRSCARCRSNGGPHAQTCNGKGGQKYCNYFDESGNPKM